MNCIIQWCNNNQGFLSAVLSLVTSIISIIAVVISIMIAYLPYKKSIVLSPIFDLDENDCHTLNLTIANTGNRLIGIRYITVEYKDKCVASVGDIKFIEQSKIDVYNINTTLRVKDIEKDKNPKMNVIITDTEGKEYKSELLIAMG